MQRRLGVLAGVLISAMLGAAGGNQATVGATEKNPTTPSAAVATESTFAATKKNPTTSSATATATGRLPISQLKIMNYYPADAGWTLMWSSYSHDRTVSDFQAIASLGANTVRIIVQPNAIGYPTPTTAMLANF